MIGLPTVMPDLGFRSEPVDAAQDIGEQVTGDGDLGHLERDVAPVADDLRADLDELLP